LWVLIYVKKLIKSVLAHKINKICESLRRKGLDYLSSIKSHCTIGITFK